MGFYENSINFLIFQPILIKFADERFPFNQVVKKKLGSLSAQSDQSLRWELTGHPRAKCFFRRKAKSCGCADFESSLYVHAKFTLSGADPGFLEKGVHMYIEVWDSLYMLILSHFS